MDEGAVWECVAEIRIRSAGMPVRFAASAFASSSTGRDIMQLSTTTIASWLRPSDSA
jgi:hypothetical protein